MNVKKAAYDAVMQKLENELGSIQYKIIRNKNNFKLLAEEQAKLKRERGILHKLINDLRGQKERVKES